MLSGHLITAVAIDGSTKWRLFDVRIAVFDRSEGCHAGISSTTKIRARHSGKKLLFYQRYSNQLLLYHF
jgi:hypothetical protein